MTDHTSLTGNDNENFAMHDPLFSNTEIQIKNSYPVALNLHFIQTSFMGTTTGVEIYEVGGLKVQTATPSPS